MKVAFLFLTLTITASVTLAENGEFYAEEPCSSQGGNCVERDECPLDIPDDHLGLCPEQQSLGAECCHGISIEETRCRKLGGECFPTCNHENLRIDAATDCASHEDCCVLL